MNLFKFKEDQSIGEVRGVDTGKIYIQVQSSEKLINARVGRLVAIQGQDVNEWLIGIINRVWREPIENVDEDTDVELAPLPVENNGVQVSIVGTYRYKHGETENYFTRAILSLPDINRPVFPIEGKELENFMATIGSLSVSGTKKPFEVGTYSLDRKAKAYLDGDRLFQRHAALLGSTGSGKSWTVATILEQASNLKHTNMVVFDIHGEYTKLPYAEQLRIAGPSDLGKKSADEVLYLPFWLLNFEELQGILIDNTETSAPNQSSAILDIITQLKKETLEKFKKTDVLDKFTIDSPIPYKMDDLVKCLIEKNEEIISTGEVYKSGDKKGEEKTVQGPLYGKLTRLLIRLQNKVNDRRYGFLLQVPDDWQKYDSMYKLVNHLMGYIGLKDYAGKGIKVIDFSEVPSDILPVMISLVARLIFQIQFWQDINVIENRHPILLVCDEAHLYIQSETASLSTLERRALENFQKIAKEGRKYGVGLLIVSQRPSDVSTTVLSQCNNIMSLRLSNSFDKSVVKALIPESLSGLLDILPGLEVGEAIVVGDAVLLPTRIILNRPKYKPLSSTVDFWQSWDKNVSKTDLQKAVENLRKQSRK